MRTRLVLLVAAAVVAAPSVSASGERSTDVAYIVEGVVTSTNPRILVRVTKANANARAGLRGKLVFGLGFDPRRTRVVDRLGRRIGWPPSSGGTASTCATTGTPAR